MEARVNVRLSIFLAGLFCSCSTIGCMCNFDSSDPGEGGGSAEEVLLEPFDAPPLDELEKTVEWIEQPVRDGMELMRERQAGETPLATVAEALSLRNDSEESNEKILSALGRLPASEGDVNWDASITRHTTGDVKSTNPLMLSSSVEFDVTGLTGFGLFGFDWKMTPFASKDTVVSWHTSQDRMYDKVVMRDDLTWSDGKPITAHDVVFSFQTIMNPRVPVPAVRSGTDQIRWVEAYDDRTLIFFHKEALATNVWNVNFPVIPKHIYEKELDKDPTLQDSDYHVRYERNPVTGGPYVISSRTPKQEIVLTRRESYYMHEGKQVRPKPHFREVRFRIIEDVNTALLALKNGQVEDMLLSPEHWTTQTNGPDFYRENTKVTGQDSTYFYFGWNVKTPFFSDKRVRRAMSYAFNHDELLDVLLYGLYEPGRGIFHPSAWTAPAKMPAPYKQDLDRAEELLEQAGWTDSDGDGIRDKMIDGQLVPFEFTILCANVKLSQDICALLAQSLERIGVKCTPKPLEYTVLQEMSREHKFQAMYGGWGAGADPDTSDNIWVTDAIKNGRNYVQYSNPEIDRLYEAGKREFDRDKRAAIYAKIHEILWEDQPYTWLYYRNAFYGFNKDLRGYVFSPRGPFHYSPGFSSFWKPVAAP